MQLEFWSWGDGYDKVVDLWNSTHPDIQVKFSSIPGGNQGGYDKLFNALKAGTSPDVAFTEFDTLNQFKVQDGLTNVADCLKKNNVADYVPSILQQVRLGDNNAIYGLPANSGPMALYYRADLFKKYDIPVPKTWDEYAKDAAKVQAADPTSYLANFSAASGNWFAALAQQAGAQWFKVDKSSWKVNIDDAPTKQVADYWQGLIGKKDVSTISDWSPEWTSALANGKIWSWVSAAWGAGAIKSAAPGTSGDWAVAPMPTWGGSGTGSANWGGGALTIPTGAKHPYEAAQFAYWVTTDPGALDILYKAIGVYPTSKKLLASDTFQTGDPFFGGQKIYEVLGAATDSLPNVTEGPSMAATYAAITDAFGTNLTDLSGSLATAEAQVVKDLKRQGLPVSK